MYEALMRLVWKGLQEWLESDHSESLCKLSDTIHTLCDIHGNASHESLNGALTNDCCIEILDLFVAYQDILRQNSGQLAQFLKPGAVSRYYLTAEHRASALRQLRETVTLRNST